MTRIDNAAPMGDKDALKREIRNEIRGEERRKRSRNCCGCLLALVLVIGVPTLLGMRVAAKSGWYKPPFMSGLYRDAEPTRLVLPLAGQDAEMVMRQLPIRAAGKYDPVTGKLPIMVTEVELTTIAADAVAKAPAKVMPFPLRKLQVVVEKTYVELFAVTPRDGRDVTLRFRLKPTIQQGKLHIDVLEAHSGQYELPQWVQDAVFESVFAGAVAASEKQFGTIGRLLDVQLDTGDITFVFYRN